MLKKLTFYMPLFILSGIILDGYIHWHDPEFRYMSIMAGLGWLFYWDSIVELDKKEKDDV